jgi:hypothetical protein
MVMFDRSARDDFQRIQLGQGRLSRLVDNLDGGGVPAFVGQVTTPSSLIGVGKFLMVQPTSLLGAEVEGESGQIVTIGSATVPVYLVGPDLASTGDYLVCRFVDNRWAAERATGNNTSGISTTPVQNCFCPNVPTTLAMTSLNPSCNYGMFQSCEIIYGPTPAGYADLSIGVYSFLSTGSFPDVVANGAMFQYILTCYYNQFNLSRVYLESPFGSPYHDGILWSWLIGAYGSSCEPFHLDGGTPYPGSDLTCQVMIDGA